jgi:hypothetical protein
MSNNKMFEVMPDKAFDNAINKGLLSNKESKDNYAGKYMYMYSKASKDFFKSILTRKYISCQTIGE